MKHSSKLAVALLTVAIIGLSATYSLAQPRPDAGPKHTVMGDAGAVHEHPCMHDGAKCPLHELLAIAELKVEKTKNGAALQLTAKDPAKVSEVQSLADKLAAHVKEGGCEMMKDKGAALHGHHHGQPVGK